MDPVAGDTYTRPSLSCDVSRVLLFRTFDDACGAARVLGGRLDAPEDLVRESLLGERTETVHRSLMRGADLRGEPAKLGEVSRAFVHLALPALRVNTEQFAQVSL